MIFIEDKYKDILSNFKCVDDFLGLRIKVVRDFKNRKTGHFIIDGQSFYIKKHFSAGFSAIFDELFHLRKPHIGATFEAMMLKELEKLNVDSMELVAWGYDDNRWLNTRRSFVVTRALENVKRVSRFCNDWKQQSPPPLEFRKNIVTKIAEIAKTIHDNGINHRDFYLCHFQVDISQGPEQYQKNPEIYLMDLHRAQKRSYVPFRWRVKDIAGLLTWAMFYDLAAKDLYRFIKVYTQKPLSETSREDRRFWKAVIKRALREYKKIKRKPPPEWAKSIFDSYLTGSG